MNALNLLSKKLLFCFLILSLLTPSVYAQNDCVSDKFDENFKKIKGVEKLHPTMWSRSDSAEFVKVLKIENECQKAYLITAQNTNNLLEGLFLLNNPPSFGHNNEAKTLLIKRFYKDMENILSNISISLVVVPFDSLTTIYGLMRINITCKQKIDKLSFEELYLLTQTMGDFFEDNVDDSNMLTKETFNFYLDCCQRITELASQSNCQYKKEIGKQFDYSQLTKK